MLEKADKHYKELVTHRNELDQLLIALTSGPVVSQVREECEEEGERENVHIYVCRCSREKGMATISLSLSLSLSLLQSSSESGVNRVIQAVAHLYCTSCKSSYNDLSKIIQVSLLNFENFPKIRILIAYKILNFTSTQI